MLIKIHPENPDSRKISQIVNALRDGAVIIYPTDTIYGIGCDIHNTKALNRIYQIKNTTPKKAQFSFICKDLSNISAFTKGISTPLFRTLKDLLPGPYTCIFESSKEVPKLLKTKRNTVGIRVPNHKISQDIISGLGNPIVSTSIPMPDDVSYYTDPELIFQEMGDLVDFVIDGGVGNIMASTIIDFTEGEGTVLREGAGPF